MEHRPQRYTSQLKNTPCSEKVAFSSRPGTVAPTEANTVADCHNTDFDHTPPDEQVINGSTSTNSVEKRLLQQGTSGLQCDKQYTG